MNDDIEAAKFTIIAMALFAAVLALAVTTGILMEDYVKMDSFYECVQRGHTMESCAEVAG